MGRKSFSKVIVFVVFSISTSMLSSCGGGSSEGGQGGPDNIESMQGTWKGNTATQAYGNLSTTFTFTQNGTNLWGNLQVTDNFTTYDETDDVTGSVNNSIVNISAIFNYQDGTKIELGYTGTAEDNTISGKTDVFLNNIDTGMGGTFTVSKDSGDSAEPNDECYNQYAACLFGCHSDVTCQYNCMSQYHNCIAGGGPGPGGPGGPDGGTDYCALAERYRENCNRCIDDYGGINEIPIGTMCERYCANVDTYEKWCNLYGN